MFTGSSGAPPIEVLVFMERSGKWPEELKAVNAVRTEFHMIMCQQLRREKIVAFVSATHLIVVLKGYSFKIRVTYQGEVVMLRKVAAIQRRIVNIKSTKNKSDNDGWANADDLNDLDDEDLSIQDCPEAQQLQIETTIKPRIMSALSGVCSQHSSYGACVRLCRRWLACHLLDGGEQMMPHLATQLLVAQLYISPGNFEAPRTPHVGFMRFLHLLANTDWRTTPCFVDLTDDFNGKDIAELRSRFHDTRDDLPALFIVTSCDIRGGSARLEEAGSVQAMDEQARHFRYALVSEWTRTSPNRFMLSHIRRTAEAALETYATHMTDSAFDYRVLFTPFLDMFDIQIHLNPTFIQRLEENLNYPELKSDVVYTTVGENMKHILTKDKIREKKTPEALVRCIKVSLIIISLLSHISLCIHDSISRSVM